MRYLVTTKNDPPFFTDWFETMNHFNKEAGMVVYDLTYNRYTTDGEIWQDIAIDHL